MECLALHRNLFWYAPEDKKEQISSEGYSPSQLLLHFWVGIWCGASCFEHLEFTRQF
jgi:hypothetical protein